MTWTSKKRRFGLVVVSAMLVVASALAAIRGKVAHASFQAVPYTQSSWTPVAAGAFFMVSIQSPLYNANSQIQYAAVTNAAGVFKGYLAVDNQGVNQVTINGTPVWVITAVFNPTIRNTIPPGIGPAQPREKNQYKPAEKKPDQPDIVPVLTSGSTLCITTNVPNDTCATMPPITINITNVNPCP